MPYRQKASSIQLAEERLHVASEREAEARISEAGAAQRVAQATQSLEQARKRVGQAVQSLRQHRAESAAADRPELPETVARLGDEHRQGETQVLETSLALDRARLGLAATRRRVVLARRERAQALAERDRLLRSQA